MSNNSCPDTETGAPPDLSTVDSSTSAARKPRGKPFEPGNHHGHGRPIGSRNKKTLLLQELLDDYGPTVVKRVIMKAVDGDRTAMKLVMVRIVPVAQDNRMELDLPELRSMADVTAASAEVISALGNGEITVEQSRAMSELLQVQRTLFVSEHLERRVAVLEQGRSTPANVPALQTIDFAEQAAAGDEASGAVNPSQVPDAR